MHRWTLGRLRALPVAGLLAAGLAVSPAAPVAASPSGTWTKTGSMITPTEQQTATLLQNGQVLMPGTAELYNPATGKWAATGSMGTARTIGFTATLLQNGQVLVAGGVEAGVNMTVTSGAELYNPATGQWAATGSMTTARTGHTATLLPSGQVLVAGGEGSCVNGSCPILASAELYNPATGTWTPTGSMTTARYGHSATLLQNGQVLVAGGPGSSAELYHPATGTWTATGSLNFPRYDTPAWLLPNGQVLVVCGINDPGVPQCVAELYTPATGTWAQDGQASQSAARNFAVALLSTGKVLISGGENGTYPSKETLTAAAVLFDPATGTSTLTGSMTIPREFHTLTPLPNGQVLAAGGETQNNKGTFSTTASAELYTP
jgi:WD40 repeat protein